MGRSASDPLREFGDWEYEAGVAGTVNVPAGSRVVGITATAASGGSVTIDGGDPIPLPAGVAFAFEPKGNLVAPEIIFDSTDAYVVEWLDDDAP